MNFNILSSNANTEEVFKEIYQQIESEKQDYLRINIKEKNLFGIGSYNVEAVKELISRSGVIFYTLLLIGGVLGFINVKMFKMDENIAIYSVLVMTVLFILCLTFVWFPLKRRVITVLFYEQTINKSLHKYVVDNINPIVIKYLLVKSPKKQMSYGLLEDLINGDFDIELNNELHYMTKINSKKEIIKEVWRRLDETK